MKFRNQTNMLFNLLTLGVALEVLLLKYPDLPGTPLGIVAGFLGVLLLSLAVASGVCE